MKKAFFAAALGATILAGTAFAAAQDAPPPPPGPRHMAMMPAPDKDGNITRASVIANVDARFAKLDTNHDGKISAEERAAAAEARQAKMQARMHDRMMRRAQAGGDMTLDQMHARAMARFDQIDTNHDGKIDQTERAAMRDKMKGMRGHGHGHGHGRWGAPPPATGASNSN